MASVGISDKQILISAGLIGLMLVIWLSVLGKSNPWVPGLDEANLLIHESGHVFFGGFGDFLGALGGTLMQFLAPLALLGYFSYRKDKQGVVFCGFWAGQNLINIGVYIKDARTRILPLVNNGTRDWHIILGQLNLLKLDGFLAGLATFFGHAIMIGMIAYAMYLLLDFLKQRAAKPLL